MRSNQSDELRVRITHPFHPLCGREFEFIRQLKDWGEDRVWLYDDHGRLRRIPTVWTDRAPIDPFVALAGGRSAFRVCDLLELAEFVEARR